MLVTRIVHRAIYHCLCADRITHHFIKSGLWREGVKGRCYGRMPGSTAVSGFRTPSRVGRQYRQTIRRTIKKAWLGKKTSYKNVSYVLVLLLCIHKTALTFNSLLVYTEHSSSRLTPHVQYSYRILLAMQAACSLSLNWHSVSPE